ncbi:Bor family protein [Eudoraea sp.]|uniref:Bor family protein n=1 Tax=Eudoraea sp. TaxID=1979955 RepID=UPI003C72C109
MKRFLSVLVISTTLSIMMSSCYSHKYVVGNGPQTGVNVTEKNNFFLFGLVPGKVSEPQKMAGDTKDFEVTEVHTFVDGLLGTITFGIYTPTTTKVQK